MNATPGHLDDETLSALLDGDAADQDAAAHLRACDRCAGRQAELASARAVLAGAPVEPVDELTRRRLVAAALQAAGDDQTSVGVASVRSRSRWASRHPAFVGSAAAVVLALLVGVPFVVGTDGNSGDANSTLAAGAPEAALNQSGSFLGDLGDLSDRENLRLRLTSSQLSDTFAYAPMEPGPSPAAGATTDAPVPSAAPVGGGLASTTTVAAQAAPKAASRNSGAGSAERATSAPAADAATSSAEEQATDQAASRDQADTDACVAALLNGPARGGRVTASGTGTFEGRPAIVAVFDLSGGRIAFVADRSGCAVLDRFSV